MYTYCFILGRNSALSAREIVSFLGMRDVAYEVVDCGRDVLILSTKEELDVVGTQRALGGTIKIGEMLGTLENVTPEGVHDLVCTGLPLDKKVFFGVSAYKTDGRVPGARENKQFGFAIKKLLRASGRSVRWVESRGSTLSSVVVGTNKLLTDRGVEIQLVYARDKVYVGRTLAVQGFSNYSHRDYGRPGRDSKSGMLPPKLAQMMVNLAMVQEGGTIMDAFCGSGTVLQEASLRGYLVLGSDLSEKAVEDTKKNLAWLSEQYDLEGEIGSIQVCDATKLTVCWKDVRVDGIVSEPFLGPQEAKGLEDLDKVIAELGELYVGAFQEFAKVLAKGSRVVFPLPYFMGRFLDSGSEAGMTIKGKGVFVSDEVVSKIESVGFNLVDAREELQSLPCGKSFRELSKRGTILYEREGQRVGREVCVFERR